MLLSDPPDRPRSPARDRPYEYDTTPPVAQIMASSAFLLKR